MIVIADPLSSNPIPSNHRHFGERKSRSWILLEERATASEIIKICTGQVTRCMRRFQTELEIKLGKCGNYARLKLKRLQTAEKMLLQKCSTDTQIKNLDCRCLLTFPRLCAVNEFTCVGFGYLKMTITLASFTIHRLILFLIPFSKKRSTH